MVVRDAGGDRGDLGHMTGWEGQGMGTGGGTLDWL